MINKKKNNMGKKTLALIMFLVAFGYTMAQVSRKSVSNLISPCVIAKDVNKYRNYIIRYSDSIIRTADQRRGTSDMCAYVLIDSLKNKLVATDDTTYMGLIERLCQSNRKLGGIVDIYTVTNQLLADKYTLFMNYAYQKRSKTLTCAIADAISNNVSNEGDEKTRNRLLGEEVSYLRTQAKKAGYSKKKMEFIEIEIIKKIDPNKFD